MRILLIHNRYKLKGGEDFVFEAEKSLLIKNNHKIKELIFDNSVLGSLESLVKLSYQLIYNVKSGELVKKAIIDFSPDVIHVHNFFYVASPSIFFVANRREIPVIVTLHNYRLICSNALLLRNASPCTLCVNGVFPTAGIIHKCHRDSMLQSTQLTITTGIHKVLKTWNSKIYRYISLTDFARNKFLNSSLGLNDEQVIVKSNSVDDDLPIDIQDREPFFLYVGRLSEEKGIDILINAFRNSSIRLDVIGDGPMRPQMEELAMGSENIIFHGFKDKPFIMNSLKRCRALIFPSICFENLPTSILEAYSVGTPVIISDIDNLNEIVTHNYNGLHFITGSSEELIKTVIDFDENISQYGNMYVNARSTYLEKYTHDMNYQQLMAIYTDATQNSFPEKQ